MALNEREIHALRQWAEGIRDETVVCPAPTMAKTVLEILDYTDAREQEVKEFRAKYLELVAMISYYTEDNKGYPYVRDSRGEVAKAAIDAFNSLNTPTTIEETTP